MYLTSISIILKKPRIVIFVPYEAQKDHKPRNQLVVL